MEHGEEEGTGTTGGPAEGRREEEEPAACGMNAGLGLPSAVKISLDGLPASPLSRESVRTLIPLVARVPSNVLHPRSPFFGPLEARPCLPRGLRHRLMFFGLPNSGRDVCCVHGVISDADWLAVGKAVRVRPINGAGDVPVRIRACISPNFFL